MLQICLGPVQRGRTTERLTPSEYLETFDGCGVAYRRRRKLQRTVHRVRRRRQSGRTRCTLIFVVSKPKCSRRSLRYRTEFLSSAVCGSGLRTRTPP